MPSEKRTRVEIFLPLASDSAVHQTVTDWLAEELAYARGGSTLTTPFTGLYTSFTETAVVPDKVQVLFCDFDLNPEDSEHSAELDGYLTDLRRMLRHVLDEEEIWIIYHSVTRIL